MYIIGWSVLDRKNGLNSDVSWSKSMKEVPIMKTTDCFHMMSAIFFQIHWRGNSIEIGSQETPMLCVILVNSHSCQISYYFRPHILQRPRGKKKEACYYSYIQNMPVLKQYGTYRITTCLIAIMHYCCFTFLGSVKSVVF